MEAIVELLAAAIGAVFMGIIGLLEAVLSMVFAFVEALFITLTQGRSAAAQRRDERRTARAKKQNSPSDPEPLAVDSSTGVSSPVSLWLTGIGVLVVLCVGVGFYLHSENRKAGIAATKQIARAKMEEIVADMSTADGVAPAAGRLETIDAWKRPLELFVDEFVTGTLLVIRSGGPDRTTGTLDDILDIEFRPTTVRKVGVKLLDKGADVVRDRVNELLKRPPK